MDKETCDPRTGEVKRMELVVAAYCTMYLCDKDGKRIFEDGDFELLGEKGVKVLDRAFRAGHRLNGFSPEAVKELEKNSETMDISDSSTPSPLPSE